MRKGSNEAEPPTWPGPRDGEWGAAGQALASRKENKHPKRAAPLGLPTDFYRGLTDPSVRDDNSLWEGELAPVSALRQTDPRPPHRPGTGAGRRPGGAGRRRVTALASPLPAGLVPEPQDEGQEAASGHDLASPGRSGVLYVHDEPRGSHREPAVSIPVPSAPALLLPHGHRRHVGLCRHPLQHPPEASGHLQGPLPPVPETRTAVRLQTSLSLPCPNSWTQQRRGQPLLLPGLPQRSVQRAGAETFRIRLYLFGHNQD